MKKKFIAIFAIVICLQSCKKNSDTQLPIETYDKVKAFTNVATGKVWTYEYDAQNRCIKEWKGNNQARREYTYSIGSIKEDEYDAAGILSDTRIHQLNSDGLSIKTNYTGAEYYTTTYNTNKQKLKLVQYNASGVSYSTTDYYYTNKLLDSTITKNNTGVIELKSIYQYYPDIKNTLSNPNYGLSFGGNENPTATKTENHYFFDAATGAPAGSQYFTYTYEKDAQERIVKQTMSGSSSSVSTITYY